MSYNLSKSLIKKFSISYAEAVRLGITDDDLKYITELSPTQFRASVPNPNGKRKTKVKHTLLDAIKQKYDFLKEIEEETKQIELKSITLKEAKGKITQYSLVKDAIDVYLKDRYKDYERGLIQITTYEQDIVDSTDNRIFIESKISNKIINEVDDDYAQNFVDWMRDLKNSKGERLAENTLYKPSHLSVSYLII